VLHNTTPKMSSSPRILFEFATYMYETTPGGSMSLNCFYNNGKKVYPASFPKQICNPLTQMFHTQL